MTLRFWYLMLADFTLSECILNSNISRQKPEFYSILWNCFHWSFSIRTTVLLLHLISVALLCHFHVASTTDPCPDTIIDHHPQQCMLSNWLYSKWAWFIFINTVLCIPVIALCTLIFFKMIWVWPQLIGWCNICFFEHHPVFWKFKCGNYWPYPVVSAVVHNS